MRNAPSAKGGVPALNTKELLTLKYVRGVGDKALTKLIQSLPQDQPLLPPDPDSWYRSKLISGEAAAALGNLQLLAAAEERANTTLDKASRLGVRVISMLDDDYPHPLRLLPDAPPILYVKGNLPRMPLSVAVIGTREPSAFGIKAARLTATALAQAGWIVTSGLAKGIDAVAHQAVVDAGGKTVAVLGNGLDIIYPKENANLAERILELGGALISEQDFGIRSSAANLVQRNRLQSGLSVGTVVCETDVKGGSMHTARFTLEQGRILFCPVPKPPYDELPVSRGLFHLLSNGARPVDGREQIESILELCTNLWEHLAKMPASPQALRSVQFTLFDSDEVSPSNLSRVIGADQASPRSKTEVLRPASERSDSWTEGVKRPAAERPSAEAVQRAREVFDRPRPAAERPSAEAVQRVKEFFERPAAERPRAAERAAEIARRPLPERPVNPAAKRELIPEKTVERPAKISPERELRPATDRHAASEVVGDVVRSRIGDLLIEWNQRTGVYHVVLDTNVIVQGIENLAASGSPQPVQGEFDATGRLIGLVIQKPEVKTKQGARP